MFSQDKIKRFSEDLQENDDSGVKSEGHGREGKDFCRAHGSSVHTMESILCPTIWKACSPVYAPMCPGPTLILSVSASVRLGPRSRRSIVIGISCSLLPYSFSQAITSQKCGAVHNGCWPCFAKYHPASPIHPPSSSVLPP